MQTISFFNLVKELFLYLVFKSFHLVLISLSSFGKFLIHQLLVLGYGQVILGEARLKGIPQGIALLFQLFGFLCLLFLECIKTSFHELLIFSLQVLYVDPVLGLHFDYLPLAFQLFL